MEAVLSTAFKGDFFWRNGCISYGLECYVGIWVLGETGEKLVLKITVDAD